jgi:integrase
VFATHLGTALMARNVHRAFKAALARAGLPASIRFHDLRHAAATLMLADKVPLKVASERLGHSTITFTADLYQHVTACMEQDAAARVAGALDRARAARGAVSLG